MVRLRKEKEKRKPVKKKRRMGPRGKKRKYCGY